MGKHHGGDEVAELKALGAERKGKSYTRMPLYRKAVAFKNMFMKKARNMRGMAAKVILEDSRVSVYAMVEAVRNGFNAKDDMEALMMYGLARGKTGRLEAHLELLGDLKHLKGPDVVEMRGLLDEVQDMLTGMMKFYKPDVDDWKKELDLEGF